MIISYYIFLFLLIFTPLAFGTEELWSLAIMEALCLVAALIYFCKLQNRSAIYRVPGIMPLILLLCFILLQIIPLPAFLIRLISPATFDLYQQTIGVIAMPSWIPLSVNPERTLAEFLRFSAYVSFYVLAVQLLTESRKLKKTVFIVLGLCSFIAFQAILQKYLDNGRIFWFRLAPPNSSFTGPYTYHNHFAGLMEMLVPVAIALFFRYRPPLHYGDSWRQRIANTLAHLNFNIYLLLGLAAMLMGVSIFVSMSRGGMISFGLSCFTLLVILSRRAKKNASIHLGLVLFAAFFFTVGWFGWDVVDQRFGMMFDQRGQLRELRPRIWQESINIIKDFPLTGTGWGTFGNIFPSYKTFLTKSFDYHAHNDYLEIIINGGIFCLVLFGWFLWEVFSQIRKSLVQRRDSYAVYLTWGSLAGILAILIHSILDFNLQNGANGLYFFFLIALAVSASNTRSHGNKKTRLLPQTMHGLRFVTIFWISILLLLSTLVNSTSLWVSRQLSTFTPIRWSVTTSEQKKTDIMTQLNRAISISPLNSYLYYLMADTQKMIGNEEAAEKFYRNAIRLNPTQADYLQEYGFFLDLQGKQNLADSFLQEGVRRDFSNPDRKRNYARFLLNDNKEKGLQVMSTVFAQDPNQAASDITFLIDSGFSDEEIRMNLPARMVPFLSFADYLEQKGDYEQAATIYRQALTYIHTEKPLRSYYFQRASRFFRKQKQYDEALDIILQAIEFFPANAQLRVEAGNLYRTMGLRHQAIQHYQQALAIDSGNPEAIKQLAKLQQTSYKKIKL